MLNVKLTVSTAGIALVIIETNQACIDTRLICFHEKRV